MVTQPQNGILWRLACRLAAAALVITGCDEFPDYGPDPDLVADAMGRVSVLFVGGDHIYWVDGAGLGRAPLAGGARELVAGPGNGSDVDPSTLARGAGVFADGVVYWIARDELYRVAADDPGTEPEVVFARRENLWLQDKLAAGNGWVVWVTATDDRRYFIEGTLWEGGGVNMEREVHSVAIDEGEIYFGDWEPGMPGAIRRLDVGRTEISPTPNRPVDIKFDASYVYWIDHSGDWIDPKQLIRAPKSGGAGVVIGDLGLCAEELGGNYYDGTFDLDGTHAYFAGGLSIEDDDCRSQAGVLRVPLAGGAAEYAMSRDEIYEVSFVRVAAGQIFFVDATVGRNRIYKFPIE